MADAYTLEEELAVREGGIVARAITAGVVLIIGAFVAAGIWYFVSRDESTASRPTEDIPVARKTINTTVLVSGIAEAELSSDLTFKSAGKIDTVNVKVGDAVRQGQVLASLEADDLANAVQSAEANLRTAQLRLQDLLAGATDAEISSARQALAQAESTLIKAESDYQKLLDGPTAADIARAEQGVATAESTLTNAESQLAALEDGASDADIAAAEAAVAQAQSALTAAENSADSASNTVDSAAASLKSAESSYCVADNSPSFCASPATPISGADLTILQNALSGPNASLAAAAIAANATYLNALNALDSAEAAVASAQQALDSAQAKLDAAEDGASDEDISAAEAAVAAAEAGLAAARETLADLQDGADAADINAAAAAVRGARAAVASAQSRLDEALRGAEANDIAQSREAVRSAQLSVEGARIRLRDSQIIAPFDGIIGAVNITAGEFVALSATEPPIVLLTPDRMQLKMDIGETDYPAVKVGQGGAARFDGLPANFYVFVISEIGLNPTTTQGVVTYPVVATLIIPPDAPRPAPGMSANGQLRVDSKPDVLVVPSRAVRRRGSEQIVDVRRSDGTVQEVVITTGISDTESVEVLTGLAEGDIVVVPALRDAGDDAEALPTIPGGIR